MATTAQTENLVTLTGGMLLGGRWMTQGAGSMLATVTGTLDGVTLAAPMTIRNATTLTVRNGLTVDGSTITIENNGTVPTLSFSGTQTLGGTGELRFNGEGTGNISSTVGGVLTIGPGVTVRTGYPAQEDPSAIPDEHVFTMSGTYWW